MAVSLSGELPVSIFIQGSPYGSNRSIIRGNGTVSLM
jgi:hypothetical protein